MKPREPRRKVLIPARMRSDDGWADVVMRNLSSRGMLLHSDKAPKKGSYIEIRKGDRAMVCRVMWAEGAEFGVLSQDKIDVDAIVLAKAPATPKRGKDGEPVERRARERGLERAAIARRAERNQMVGRAMQFGFVAIGVLSTALFVTAAAKETLARPLAVINEQLRRAG